MSTALTTLAREWNDDVAEVRRPFWLNKKDRATLAESIIDLFAHTAIFPTMRADLDAVLTELGVAEARDQVWPEKAEIVRVAHGYTPDTLPIRMSDSELDAVLSISTLAPGLQQRLAGTRETK